MPTHEGPPRARVCAPQGSRDPVGLRTWLDPELGGPRMEMKGPPWGWHCREWGK